ncbi:MAG: replicative DNA helicase, partial [Chloroflexota bacterium]
YEAILALGRNSRPVDFVTVMGELRRRGQLDEVGGEAVLFDLLNVVPTSIHAESYGRAVHNAAMRREMIRAASEIARLAWDESSTIDSVVGSAEQALFAATAQMTAGNVTDARTVFGDLLDTTLARKESGGALVGLPTGLVDLDRLLGGYKKSDLIVVAGRPGMGKTSFMNSNIVHLCGKLGKRVAMFTMEMSAEQESRRIAAMEAGIEYGNLERGQMSDDEWRRFGETAGRWASANLWIDDTSSITPGQVLAKARRLYAEHGLDAVFVDYIGLMGTDDKAWSENHRISLITAGLKRLARELNIPVISLAQLNRAVETRNDKRPQLSDLRDSGSVEQDASVVIFLYRDEYYNPDSTDRPAQAEAIVAKHRNGPTGSVSLFYQAKRMQFGNIAKTDSYQLADSYA